MMELINKEDILKTAREIVGEEAGYKAWAILNAIREAQPVGRCEDCVRNADNGILYPDGRTMCPIQEHYGLLKDGYCHLYSECIGD